MLHPPDWKEAHIGDPSPLLMVLIDTEEEFDWSKPVARENVGTTSIKAQHRAHRIFEKYGVRPTYVIDYPVATRPDGYQPLMDLHRDGLCEIGAHLHPWVNPPFDEEVCNRNSYPGNLPADIEREKLIRLTRAIEDRFGFAPKTYKAGRYGVGPASAAIIEELGYEVDNSVVPRSDFTGDEGPDFSHCDIWPYWFGTERRLLELPMSVGFVGRLAGSGLELHRRLMSPVGKSLRAPGIFSRLGLFERIRLTPEGHTHDEHRKLTMRFLDMGVRVFNLTYHSPSLEPGFTPYVQNADDLDRFLETIDRYLSFFIGEVGGRVATASEIRTAMTSEEARVDLVPA